MSLQYAYTNECLDAVVRGMDAGKGDDIIAICGSGDQAFALLEYADSVIAIDKNKRQIEYAMKRAEALKAGDYEGFLTSINETNSEHAFSRGRENAIKYFNRNSLISRIFGKSRLEKIKSKLGSLEFRHADIHNFVRDLQGRRYSKAYLSNLMSHDRLSHNAMQQRDFLQMVAARLRNPGIIYLADGGDFCLKHMYNLEEDKKLTEIAAKREKNLLNWQPRVYRRKQ